ncbi:hypothetical protein [Pseudobdellovibrio exovorus]|uniref:EF-hand domain-containing protein n=1 Tax=Pseudobdellovibrio exovorus JSS TaxID=1184267 RepID=M4V5A8_9BACT|nr:hypothetical protein [Pseudobdellovibrio exovorus]AGH94507.1 hypothetical protein A11Q_287 [Pseudobdellovibrio exovorus JSS]
MKLKTHQKTFAISFLLTALVMTACTVTPGTGKKDSSDFSTERWNHFDIDRNASLDKKEFENFLKDAFAKLDTDGDGFAHTHEVPPSIRRFDRNSDGKVAWAEYQASALEGFAKADTDKNGMLSYAEIASLDFLR